MTVLRSFLEYRNIENPLRPLTDASLLGLLGGEATEAGIAMTPEKSLGLSAVYRSIALLAGLVGSLPMQSYRREGNARLRIDNNLVSSPHPEKTAHEVWEQAGMSLFSHGNSYQLKVRDGGQRIRELEPLLPQNMTRVERKKEWRTGANPTGKRFFYQDGPKEFVYTPYDVLHIPGLSYNGLVGLSPLGLARQGISLSLAAEQFGARMFGRGALIQGVLETDASLEEPTATRLQLRWAEKTSGGANQWRIPVLDNGAKFKPISLPPADVQFLETRRFGVQEVSRWYGLPPHLLGDVERSTSWGTGIEQQNMQMLTFTADPWLVRIEQRVTKELMVPGEYVKINRGALLRSDTATRYMAHQRAITNGWENADEIRELEDMDPIPNGLGQTYYRPANLVAVGSDQDQEGDDGLT